MVRRWVVGKDEEIILKEKSQSLTQKTSAESKENTPAHNMLILFLLFPC